MIDALKQIKKQVLSPWYANVFQQDVRKFEGTKVPNAAKAYQNMINAFCSTGGKSLTKASAYIAEMYPKKELNGIKAESMFSMDRLSFDAIDAALKQHGYYVLPERLSDDYINQLYSLALHTPAIMRPMDGKGVSSFDTSHMGLIDLENPTSILYSLPEQVLINHPLVQKIVTDYTFLNIAQNYLGCEPIWDVTSLWWSTNASKKSDKNAAQWFHFDMDRIRWIKVFIYLTDVNADNGPHTFIDGSNRDGDIPMSLLTKGYQRLSDEEVSRAYSKEKFIEFTAPKGTIIIEDTRGLHKGKNVTGDPRCLLQFQYSNSIFGAVYPKVKLEQADNFVARMNRISSRFLSRYI